MYFTKDITLRQYKMYIDAMEENEDTEDIIGASKQIIQIMTDNKESLSNISKMEAYEFFKAVNDIHFVMQEIITKKMMEILPTPEVEKETSIFDEYDKENGYEDDDSEENQWKICKDIMDKLIKLSIRLLGNSYSQCMNENALQLFEYLGYEIATINDK